MIEQVKKKKILMNARRLVFQEAAKGWVVFQCANYDDGEKIPSNLQ